MTGEQRTAAGMRKLMGLQSIGFSDAELVQLQMAGLRGVVKDHEGEVLVRNVPLHDARGVFKACRWCMGQRGRISQAPLIEPARHVGRMICDDCGRQTGWVSAKALRRAKARAA